MEIIADIKFQLHSAYEIVIASCNKSYRTYRRIKFSNIALIGVACDDCNDVRRETITSTIISNL